MGASFRHNPAIFDWRDAPSASCTFSKVTFAFATAGLRNSLASLDLAYPKVDETKLKELAAAKKKLFEQVASAGVRFKLYKRGCHADALVILGFDLGKDTVTHFNGSSR